MAQMKKMYCRECEVDTWQNPLKPPADKSKQQEYRCTQCGRPVRTGGGAKNYGVRRGFPPKIMFEKLA